MGVLMQDSSVATRGGDYGVVGLLGEIRTEIAACELCPAMAPYSKPAHASRSTVGSSLMLVVDAPGPVEGLLTDAAGLILRAAVRDVGHEVYQEIEDLFYVTHAVRCRPPHPKDRAKSRTPSVVECKTCRPYFMFETRVLHPRWILAVGSKAATAVLGRPVRIREEHGQRYRMRDAEVVPLLTPSPANRASLNKLGMTVEGYQRWLTGLFGGLIDQLA